VLAAFEIVAILPVTAFSLVFLHQWLTDLDYAGAVFLWATLVPCLISLIGCWTLLLLRIRGRFPERWSTALFLSLVPGILLALFGFCTTTMLSSGIHTPDDEGWLLFGCVLFLAPFLVAVHQGGALMLGQTLE
jgi:hypothetical protein